MGGGSELAVPDAGLATAAGGEESAAGGSGRWHAQASSAASRRMTRVGSGQGMSAREVYQRTKKVPDLFWNRFVCRPLAAVLVDALRGTRVTPNQITLASFLVGLVAAGLMVAVPGHLGLLVAVLVYQFSYVLDCADGMLARWRGIASPSGHLLDFLMDEIKAFLILGAAAMRLHFERHSEVFLLLGIVGLVALASGIALTSFQRHPEIAGPRSSNVEPPRTPLARVVRAIEGVAKLLIHYPSYILYVAIAGRLEWYLYPYIAVNMLYAGRAWLGVAVRFGRRQ